MNQSASTTSTAPNVISVIALVVSGIALICVVLLLIISKTGTGQGGSATAITNSAALSVAGMVFFTAFTWIFAILGGLTGLIMLINEVPLKSSFDTKMNVPLWFWNLVGRLQWFINCRKQLNITKDIRKCSLCLLDISFFTDKIRTMRC